MELEQRLSFDVAAFRARILRHASRFLVRGSPVTPRHRRLQHPQVNAQLRAVMRRVGDEDRAKDRGARSLEDDLVAESQRPRRSRPLPRELLKYPLDLRAQLVEHFHTLGATRKLCLRATPGQSIVFVGRQHQDSETWELRDMSRELAERAGPRVRTPILFAVRHALEHAARRRDLRIQIGEQKSERRILLARFG